MECWKEGAAGWWMEPTASPWVSAGASRTITSALLGFQRHAAVSVVLTAQLSSHILPLLLSMFPLPALLSLLPSLLSSSLSPSARLGSRTSPVGWIRGRLPVAVGCYPEVHAEQSQSPPWTCHVPDLWPPLSEGHIRLLWQEALLVDAGHTEQPAGQQNWFRRQSQCYVVYWFPNFFFDEPPPQHINKHHPTSSKCVHLNYYWAVFSFTLLCFILLTPSTMKHRDQSLLSHNFLNTVELF